MRISDWSSDVCSSDLSWLGAEWSTAPRRIGDKIARLLGAAPGEIIATDSTSVNIFKALTAALSLRPGRAKLLSEATNFPTDVYMMQSEEQTSELQSIMRIQNAVCCLQKKNKKTLM